MSKPFDDPSLENVPYTMKDVEQIEKARGKPYTRLRATVAALEKARSDLSGARGVLQEVVDALS